MAPTPDISEDLRARAQGELAAGRLDAALALFRAACEASPADASARHDLGCALKVVGRSCEAKAMLETALGLDPDRTLTKHALAFVLLTLGDYRRGFELWEARHELGRPEYAKPALPFPEWRGQEVAGKRILLFPEQGLGDQIMFARFAPWLAQRGANPTLLCAPPLTRLFSQFKGVEVVAAAGRAEFADPDLWVMVGSIAGRAGLGPADLPNAPYLRANVEGPRIGARIGVAVRGNPGHKNDAHRSLDAASAAALRALPGAIDLAPDATGARDFAETAALVDQLDLVVTVDTSVAHLAGAMGKPVWILLPWRQTDWRWMEGRTDSPWYPTARLMRQPGPGDWASVVDEVRRDVAALGLA